MPNIFRGYMVTVNKRPTQQFGNNEPLLTFEEANQKDELAGVLDGGHTVIDVDNADEAERLKKVVEAMKLNCMIIRTTRGMHFIFGNSRHIQKNLTNVLNALGIRFDVKCGKNSYIILKQDGKLREVIRHFDENLPVSECPNFLSPIKNGLHLSGMVAGSGRNSALYRQTLTLIRNGFSKEEVRKIASLINDFIFNEHLDEKELLSVTRDELFTQLLDKPIEFPDSDLPDYPIDTFPEPFKSIAEAIAEHTQTAIDMTAINILGVIATAIQGKLKIEGKQGYHEPLNIYLVIVAQPAERKSPVNQAVTATLYRYEKKKNEELQPQIDEQNIRADWLKRQLDKALNAKATTVEDIVSKQLELRELEQHKVKPMRLVADNTTLEALTTLLYEGNGKLSLISAEGGIFHIFAGQYSKNAVNIDSILKAHAGESIRVDRKGRPSEIIDNPTLTMAISMQDSLLNEIVSNEQFIGRGLVARILFSKPTSKVGARKFDTEPIPPDVEDAYEEAVWNLLDTPTIDSVLKLSAEAREVAVDWYMQLEPMLKEELAHMNDWGGKLFGATLRLAGLLHCMKYYHDISKNLDIDLETMQNAVKTGKYFLEHARWVYSAIGLITQMTKAKYVWEKIQASGAQELTRREIQRLLGQYRTLKALVPALDLLVEYGYLSVHEQVSANNKALYIYRVSPHSTNVTDETD